jgi:two-component system, NtrC family, response regulator GlrR
MSAPPAAARRILVVDDDAALLRLLSLRLQKEGFAVAEAASGEEALGRLAAAIPDLVITDMRMGGMDGLALFEAVNRRHPALPVIILTAHGNIPDAVHATRKGVFSYLTKPFEARALMIEVERALEFAAPAPAGDDEDWRVGIVTRSPAMERVLAEACMVARNDAAVLLSGESGTGKELLARAIHEASGRRDAPFVAVNCGAIPEALLESELFGHVKGAFTGALRDHKGLFQAAGGGTLFLDEIGDMALPLQVKLLRVLQEREVRPVGSAQSMKVNVRVISATHRDLRAEIAANRFREDLYYRLNVVGLSLPSLAGRREDIPLLANHFLALLAARYGKAAGSFAPEAMQRLVSGAWKGNVRELQNVIEKCVALTQTPVIPASMVERAMEGPLDDMASFDEARRAFELEYLTRLLRMTNGNVTQAARLAKRNRSDFYSLLGRHQLDPAAFK